MSCYRSRLVFNCCL